MAKKPHILDFDSGEWEDYIISLGEKKYRAAQIFEWLHAKQVLDVNAFSNVPEGLKQQIREDFNCDMGTIKDRQKSEDGTEKILLEFADGRDVEAVLLRNQHRTTVCVSTQVGCSLYCDFCRTARGKFAGNLSAGEILEQVYLFAGLNREERISNVVFMGMGEPFMNYDNSLKAAHLLNHAKGMAIGTRKITLSTAGVLPGIEKFTAAEEPFNLAISIHSLDPVTRAKLMDSEKKWPLESILSFIENNKYGRLKNRVTIEYIMISGLNMSESDALKLVKAAKRVSAKVNLIPLNFEFENYHRPDSEEINEFWQNVKKNGVEVFNRASLGYDILAACGMLRSQNEKTA